MGKQVRWSPGSRIQYSRPKNRNIGLIDPNDGVEFNLLHNESVGWMTLPGVMSPNGEEIAAYWNRYCLKNDEQVRQRGLWLISLIDSSQSYIFPDENFYPFGWSEDGNWIFGSISNHVVRVPRDGRAIADTVFTLPQDHILEVAKGRNDRGFEPPTFGL
jgi:hypothetical protein